VNGAVEEFDWHLRRHRLGTTGPRLEFDWDALFERRLVLVPNFEQDSRPVYQALRASLPDARFLIMGREPSPLPDPGREGFFVDVESAIASVADAAGNLFYVSFFSEEAYLAATPEASLSIFGEHVFDLLARAWANCVSRDILRMRRHRHGLRIFRDALRHFNRLRPQLEMPDSIMI
jgi:hypothetical protein